MQLLQTGSACCLVPTPLHTVKEESCGDVPLYSPGLPRKTDEYKTPLRASFAAAARASAGEGHSLRVVHHFPAQTNDDRYQRLNSPTIFWNFHVQAVKTRLSVWIKNQLYVTFCILYFSSNSCSTCFGQPCTHHQELTTA